MGKGGCDPWCWRDSIDFIRQVMPFPKNNTVEAFHLLIQSRDGTRSGYDTELLKAVSEAVNVPVIASGGASTSGHMVDAFKVHTASSGKLTRQILSVHVRLEQMLCLLHLFSTMVRLLLRKLKRSWQQRVSVCGLVTSPSLLQIILTLHSTDNALFRLLTS